MEQILRISALGGHGDGVAETPGGRVFVPFALAGETVRAEVTGPRARLLEVIEPAPDRVPPVCPHFTACGGCAVQHLRDGLYREWKRGVVETALAHRGLEAPVEAVVDAHGAGRRRVTLHVRFNKGRVIAGFMRPRSHRVLDLDHCPILEPALGNVTEIARALAAPFVRPDGGAGRTRWRAGGPSRGLDIAVTATETGLDCDIRGAGAGDIGLAAREELSAVAGHHDLARVSVDGDVVLARRAPMVTLGAVPVSPPPGAFGQATRAGEDALAALVLEHAGDARRVADLFCGVGPFALRLAAGAVVLAVDSDVPAIAALSDAARRAAGLKPITTEVHDLQRDPLPAARLAPLDAVIFDPPRAGAHAQAREIAASGVATVIAVSCDPPSFARDAALLTAAGYSLDRVTPVDQFRYASPVELVAVLRRG